MILVTSALVGLILIFCAVFDPPGHERRDDDYP